MNPAVMKELHTHERPPRTKELRHEGNHVTLNLYNIYVDDTKNKITANVILSILSAMFTDNCYNVVSATNTESIPMDRSIIFMNNQHSD